MKFLYCIVISRRFSSNLSLGHMAGKAKPAKNKQEVTNASYVQTNSFQFDCTAIKKNGKQCTHKGVERVYCNFCDTFKGVLSEK